MNRTTLHTAGRTGTFSQPLSSTPRGARLARLLAMTELRTWHLPGEVTERAELLVAELAANAVRHGRVQGRDFRLRLRITPATPAPLLTAAAPALRIEVTDARGERLPTPSRPLNDRPDGGGHGLALVAAYADRWGWEPHPPGGKTVWAEVDLPPGRH
ncbi:ATP-binding protein [Streptomyces sp. HSG2]|uniref:ATP-binding protein n=1 Tax=Streptomyces sp. HSG2 TaxID=2797167 RepID=UPI0019047642|nr:ATP-binding protein [Streptomyces sp. HSG2]